MSSSSKSLFSWALTRRDPKLKNRSESSKGAVGLTTLFSPSHDSAVADIVFVHGLNGGSQSTWTKNGDPSLFWPKEWLPNDHAFRDVRIHTFGYSSGINRESILSVPDFSRSLLAALVDAPSIPRDAEVRVPVSKDPTTSAMVAFVATNAQKTPLILVGHSMGGLVIKKAFIIGHQTQEFQPLVRRVRAIFFLATPHQGAGLAVILNRLLSLEGPRPFVNDLFPDSPILRAINDEFPRLCRDIQLFSFWETKSTTGIGLVVEKHSAVMNYPNERKTYLDANHRDVARFSSPDDPPFLAVRNALATVIDRQRHSNQRLVQTVDHERQAAINKFLGVSDLPEDDIMVHDTSRVPGSCEWLLNKQSFLAWRDEQSPRILWLRGRPGAGKSILAGYVVNHLRSLSVECCFFFFVERDNTKATVSAFLRSMAWQMAMMHPQILGKVSEIAAGWQGSPVDKMDHNQVWRQLFLAGILKVRLDRPLYWIIDALDECRANSEFLTYLTKIQEQWPLSILVTSRTHIESHMPRALPLADIHTETISDEDTQVDIALFLQANLHLLPAATRGSNRQIVADRILERSRGSFLWADLVFKELRQVHTAAEIEKVLDSTPSDMGALYQRILDCLSQAEFGRPLTRAILTWATYSFRPLTTEEARVAIELDLDDTIDDISRAVTECGGNLVYIDSQHKLQLLHGTAKEFLMRNDVESELILRGHHAHKRLALACLKNLTTSDKAPGRRAISSTSHGAYRQTPFRDYAANFIFQHLHNVSSDDNDIFIAIAKFLASPNVLNWIEYIATHSDLQIVFQAGKTISNLLNRRAQHSQPQTMLKEISLIHKWANDLTHLVTKFAQRLRLCPPAIYHLIPPFCPRDSAIRQQFAPAHSGLAVQGLSARGWDDCLTSISYRRPTKPNVVACGPGRFAVGMANGKIVVYDDIIFQEIQELDHGEPVWRLAFSASDRFLASASGKSIKVWDLNVWQEHHRFPVRALCMSLAFADGDSTLLAAMRNNKLLFLDLVEGAYHEDSVDWTRDFGDEGPGLAFREPTMAAINPATGLMAVIYRGEDILLWDFINDRIHDFYEKETGSRSHYSKKLAQGVSTVRAVTFSQASETNLLATTYFDGDLYVYNTEDGNPVANCLGSNAMVLVSSPDGRTLAGSDSNGCIILHDFETLKVLCRIRFDNSSIIAKSIAITADNLRLVEVRGHQCRVWGPPALLRQEMDDDQSDAASLAAEPQEIDDQSSDDPSITAIACAISAPIVFCGKEDGSVHVYDISREPKSQEVFVQSRNCPITLIHFDEAYGILVCGDSASRITGRKLVKQQQDRWEVAELLIDAHSASTTTQLLVSGKHSRLLLSSEKHDTLWALPEHGEGVWLSQIEGHKRARWLSHPSNIDHLIQVQDNKVLIYDWETLECLISAKLPPDVLVKQLHLLQSPKFFVTASQLVSSSKSPQPQIVLWDFSSLDRSTIAAPVRVLSNSIASAIEGIIGSYESRLVYLSSDYWVCSIDMESEEGHNEVPIRHFFIPYDWVSVVQHLVMGIGSGGQIIFVKQSELAVIKRGLEVTEAGPSSNPRRASAVPMRPNILGQRGPVKEQALTI